MTAKRKTLALIGCGTIGGYILKTVAEVDAAQVVCVCDADTARARALAPKAKIVATAAEVAGVGADLVVEAANAEAVASAAIEILGGSDFLAFSVTAFADAALEAAVGRRCAEAGTRMLIPHGAILGLDGVFDGRKLIDTVTVRTVKSPESLGLRGSEAGVVYDGPTREACLRFPRNVNVHATLAVMGIGFDRQRSLIVADPETSEMRHEILVEGRGLKWSLTISSQSLGGVTGAFTPVSAASTVLRALGATPGFTLA